MDEARKRWRNALRDSVEALECWHSQLKSMPLVLDANLFDAPSTKPSRIYVCMFVSRRRDDTTHTRIQVALVPGLEHERLGAAEWQLEMILADRPDSDAPMLTTIERAKALAAEWRDNKRGCESRRKRAFALQEKYSNTLVLFDAQCVDKS